VLNLKKNHYFPSKTGIVQLAIAIISQKQSRIPDVFAL